MKLGTHIAFNFFAGMAVHLDPLQALLLAVGGVVPDIVDWGISLGNRSLWYKVHRTLSHWPWPYLVGVIFLQSHVRLLCAGAFLHCALDALTPTGIPFFSNPFQRKGRLKLALIKTGSMAEGVVIAAPVLLWVLSMNA